jgi:tetratricopeptide (TPR) repeat protein
VALDAALGLAETFRGAAYIELGKFDAALKSCLSPPLDINSYVCLAIAYKKLGRTTDAQAALRQLHEAGGDSAAWQMVEVYASLGDTDAAIQWLQTAARLRDPGLIAIRTDPRVDSVRQDPRFQAIERELKLPD